MGHDGEAQLWSVDWQRHLLGSETGMPPRSGPELLNQNWHLSRAAGAPHLSTCALQPQQSERTKEGGRGCRRQEGHLLQQESGTGEWDLGSRKQPVPHDGFHNPPCVGKGRQTLRR